MTLGLKKIHVIFIFLVGYSWLVKLVRSFTTRKTVYVSLSFLSSGNIISSSNSAFSVILV